MDDSAYVIVRIAAEKTGYTSNYIRRLIRAGLVPSKNIGVWLVHLPSLEEYKTQMDEQGTKKYNPTVNYKKTDS
ncbi:MAG: hypothetical protein KDE47_04860 [Caldilineaceae bacterium]|nr:hypothetical protein [Caldilineaceae bacterium]